MSSAVKIILSVCLFTVIVCAILFIPACSSAPDEISQSTPYSVLESNPGQSHANNGQATATPAQSVATGQDGIVLLPSPNRDGKVGLEKTLDLRRSIREYKDEPLSLSDIGQILWSAQGITEDIGGYRTSPSAGALYPAEIYVVAGNVEGLESGVYRYVPVTHTIIRTISGDLRARLHEAALRQDAVKNAPVSFIITGIYERTTSRYGDRGRMYVHFEVGHIGQNISLQTVALNLGTVVIGAFENDRVRDVLNLPASEEPFYIMPCGKPVQNP